VLISSITHGSYANGPGKRNVLHTQGCSIGCPGCFNPHTWSTKQGEERDVEDIYKELTSGDIEGITISGGEPTEQWGEVSQLLRLVRENRPELSVVLFTGISLDRLPDDASVADVVVSGPYERALPCEDPLRSSENQTIVFMTDRYNKEDLDSLPRVEVHIDENGGTISGFPSGYLVRALKKEMG